MVSLIFPRLKFFCSGTGNGVKIKLINLNKKLFISNTSWDLILIKKKKSY